MERNFVLLLGVACFFVAVNCSSADTEVDVKVKVVSSSNSNSNFTGSELGGSELVSNDTDAKKVDNVTNTIEKQSDSTGNGDLGEGKGDLGDVSKLRGKYGENDGGEKMGNEEAGNEALTTSSRKEGFHGEECDPSNMCTDKGDQFVACLRVPGNDSPHLSLLIQNKGKSPLIVSVSAPDFVQLEKNKFQLLKNEDKKLKVSIRSGKSGNNSITLTAGKGHCSLDLKDLLSQNTGNDDDSIASSHSSFMNVPSQALIVIIFIVVALVLVPAFIHIYRNKSRGKKYQRLDMELPVSNNVSKPGKESSDGWNNDWGDDWDDDDDDDEETPKTPPLPVTPSVSSRGLASRRLSKESWKD